MKKLAFVTAAFVALGAGAAFADSIENSYGNTFEVTLADGSKVHYTFDADHSFMMAAGDTHTMGAWEIAGDQLCLTPQGGERSCSTYVGDKNIGDSWTQTTNDGQQITVTLNAGR